MHLNTVRGLISYCRGSSRKPSLTTPGWVSPSMCSTLGSFLLSLTPAGLPGRSRRTTERTSEAFLAFYTGHCQVPEPMGSTPSYYVQSAASTAPPDGRSIESSFGTASSLLSPHCRKREYAYHTFPGGGKCVLTGKRRNFHWGFLEWCCSCLHVHLGSRLHPWGLSSPPAYNPAGDEKLQCAPRSTAQRH